MSDGWLVLTDSEGFIARIGVRRQTFELEWRTYKGEWKQATVTQQDGDSVSGTIAAILALQMDRNERLDEGGPSYFVVSSRSREPAIGWRFRDDGKYWWNVSDGWIPDEKGYGVNFDYLVTGDSIESALDYAIGYVLGKITQKKGEEGVHGEGC